MEGRFVGPADCDWLRYVCPIATSLACGGTTSSGSMNLLSNSKRRVACSIMLLVAISCFVIPSFVLPAKVWAQLDTSLATGSTSSTLRKQAATRIPYNQMSPAIARKVSAVVNDASLYRQLPVTTIESDPDMYLFLLRYPETIISTWRLMGISEMTARRVAPFSLQATDGAGTKTQADLVYGQPNMNIYYAEGEYDGPMIFRKVTGKCVIMVESNYTRAANGKVNVTSRMNFFLKIDNLAASIIAKTVHPLVGTTADHNFVETLKFAEKLSETSSRNGPGVQRMADRLPDLSPDVRNRFKEMAGIVWQRAQGGQTGQPSASVATTNMQTGFSDSMSSEFVVGQNAGFQQPASFQNSQATQAPGYQQPNFQQQSFQQPSLQQPAYQVPGQGAISPPPRTRYRTLQQLPERTKGPTRFTVGDSVPATSNRSPTLYRGR